MSVLELDEFLKIMEPVLPEGPAVPRVSELAPVSVSQHHLGIAQPTAPEFVPVPLVAVAGRCRHSLN